MRIMNRGWRSVALLALALVGATLAFAQGAHTHGADTQPGVTQAPSGAMDMGLGIPVRAANEVEYLTHMIPHHQEAIDSAQALLLVTERPELRGLATSILAEQTAEIQWMEQWLAERHPDAPRAAHYQPMMRDLGPGASVAAIERAFLEDMVMHHMMAVRDSQLLLQRGAAEHDEVNQLARTIIGSQMTEIMLMRTWLADWFDAAAPMGMAHGDDASDAPAMAMGHHDQGHDALDAATALRLAHAFLAGRGQGRIDPAAMPALVFEVRFDDAHGGGVLLIDAVTGTVRLLVGP